MPVGARMNLVKRKQRMEESRLTIKCAWPGCESSVSVYLSQGFWGVGRKKESKRSRAYCPQCKAKVESVAGKAVRMNGFGRFFSKLEERREARVGNCDALRIFLLVSQDSECACCKKQLSYSGHPAMWQVDHIKPVAIGGNSSIENLQALCTECHSEKSGRELKIVRPHAGKTATIKHWMTHYQKDQLIKSLQRDNARLKSVLASHVSEEEMAG